MWAYESRGVRVLHHHGEAADMGGNSTYKPMAESLIQTTTNMWEESSTRGHPQFSRQDTEGKKGRRGAERVGGTVSKYSNLSPKDVITRGLEGNTVKPILDKELIVVI